MLFIEYSGKGFGLFEVSYQAHRSGGGYENKCKTIKRKLKFDEDGKPKVFYNGKLRWFSIADGQNGDYKKMLEYFK